MEDPRFRSDLYRGTAQYYDRFRPGYPALLIADLKIRTGLTGTGRLLDLGCGTGHIAFALKDCFDEVWAIDQEPDMVAFCQGKARAGAASNIRCIQSTAEDLSMPDCTCKLNGIGNAFHRFDRARVASRCLRWLEPGGHLALLWGGSPWRGPDPWQQTLSSLMDRWMATLDVQDRVPAGHEKVQRQRPDLLVLTEAGFDLIGSWEFLQDHWWTPEDLVGFMLSTSVLSPEVLAGRVQEFEEDLGRTIAPYQVGGVVHQTMRFAYELAQVPS